MSTHKFFSAFGLRTLGLVTSLSLTLSIGACDKEGDTVQPDEQPVEKTPVEVFVWPPPM